MGKLVKRITTKIKMIIFNILSLINHPVMNSGQQEALSHVYTTNIPVKKRDDSFSM